MKRPARGALFCAVLLLAPFLPAQERTLDTLFPDMSGAIKTCLEKENIYINTETAAGFKLRAAPNAGIPNLVPESGNFKYLIETLIFISEAKHKTVTDVYNALKDVKTLEGRSYYSARRQKEVVLFQEAVRIVSEKNYKVMPGEGPVSEAPNAEIRYMRLKDGNFGNCYYRADAEKWGPGIYFSLTNFKSISFLFIPIIRERELLFNYYIEPLSGGLMIYGLIGVRANALADIYVDIPSSITKRIAVINEWIIDGLREKQYGQTTRS